MAGPNLGVSRSVPGRRRAVVAAAVLAAVVAACARPVKVEGEWAEGVPRDRSYHNVLVVGLTPNFNTRCRFERLMAASLRSTSVTATASCTLMGVKDPLTRETIVPLVASQGADSVLVTELIDSHGKVVEGGDRETRGQAYYKPAGYGYTYGYYGAYGLPVTYVDFVAEQSEFTLERSVVIGSRLFDTRDAAVAYAMQTTARDMKSRDEVLDVVTHAVGEQLRSEGVVAAGRGGR